MLRRISRTGQFVGRVWTDTADNDRSAEDAQGPGRTSHDAGRLHAASAVEKMIGDRKAMGEGKQPLDWGMAEHLAYATLVNEGTGVRLSKRGLWSAARSRIVTLCFHDQNREKWDSSSYIPLQHINPKQGDFTVIDSILPEEAVLGFGVRLLDVRPNQLVIWEAQFGDFANGAQVVIDQFISSGEVKWGRVCGPTLLLPHGYEGQGRSTRQRVRSASCNAAPSTACRIVVPSTPAQCYHAAPTDASRLAAPADRDDAEVAAAPRSRQHAGRAGEGSFQTVIGETDKIVARTSSAWWSAPARSTTNCWRIAANRTSGCRDHPPRTAVSVPHDDFKAQLKKFPNAHEIVWCQEEPQNQGAWYRLMAYFRADIKPEQVLLYGRSPSAHRPPWAICPPGTQRAAEGARRAA